MYMCVCPLNKNLHESTSKLKYCCNLSLPINSTGSSMASNESFVRLELRGSDDDGMDGSIDFFPRFVKHCTLLQCKDNAITAQALETFMKEMYYECCGLVGR